MAESLRIVTFNALPAAYGMVAAWAAQRGHRIVLAVTPAAADVARYGSTPEAFVAAAPGQDVLVSSRMRTVVAPTVAALAPDLIVAATFPLRIPASITRVPRLGALNYHPTPLPLGRGPNPQRLVYEGHPTLAGTLHRIAPEIDGGAILSQRERPATGPLTAGDVMRAWGELLWETLDEGVARAAAGDPGDPQDEAAATYAAPFTDEERRIRWNEPARTIHRKAAALNIGGPTALATIGGRDVLLTDVVGYPGKVAQTPGTILARDGDLITVAVGDGTVAARIVDRG